MTVTDTDLGYRRLVRDLRKMPDLRVVVGIRQDAGLSEDGESLAAIATYNEFGLGVPERSFMRSTFDERKTAYDDIGQRELGRVVDGKQDVRQALGRLGLVVTGDVQAKIVDLREPPNAPLTIALKGSSNPLIDTGRMRQSIGHEVRTGASE
jgi:hypothetical protein